MIFLLKNSGNALWVSALLVLTFISPAQADIANQCEWKKECIEGKILQETNDLYSRLVWSSTLNLNIDGLIDSAITNANENSFQTNTAIVRYLFEKERIRDALRLSIAGREQARSGQGFIYPGLLQGDRVVDLSSFSPAFPAILYAIKKDEFSLGTIETITRAEIETLATNLPVASGDRHQDQQRLLGLRNLSKYGFWDEFAKFIVPIEPTLISSAVWHAEEFDEYNRAIFLASVDNHLIKTGAFPSDRDSGLSDPLRRIFRSGANPVCFSEQEIGEFLMEARWPDFSEPRTTCLEFFLDFSVFDGSGFLELYIENLIDKSEREQALDFLRDIALDQPSDSDVASILVNRLLQVEGESGSRAQHLVEYFFEDKTEMRSESIRLSGALKQTSYIDDLIAWRKEPHENVDRKTVNRPWYFTSYPRRGPFGISQSEAFSFYDDILTAFPKEERGIIEFFFVLFSRGVDWNDPNTTSLIKSLGEKHNVNWRIVLEAKTTTMLLTALNPNNREALKFILDEAILDQDGRYLPLDKLDEGYAYYLVEAMWEAGFCNLFHKNASDPRIVEELASSKRGYDYFNLHQLYENDAEGCWKS